MKELKYNGLLSEDTKKMVTTLDNKKSIKITKILIVLAIISFTSGAIMAINLPLCFSLLGVGTLNIILLAITNNNKKKRNVSETKIKKLANELSEENVNVKTEDIVYSYEQTTDLLRRVEHEKEIQDASIRYFCMLNNEQKITVLKEIRNYMDNTNKLFLLDEEETKNSEVVKGLRLTK